MNLSWELTLPHFYLFTFSLALSLFLSSNHTGKLFVLRIFPNTNIMADNKSKTGKQDRNKVNGSENYEIQYFKEKMGVSSQAVTGAIRATGSNDRKVLEDYLKKRHSK